MAVIFRDLEPLRWEPYPLAIRGASMFKFRVRCTQVIPCGPRWIVNFELDVPYASEGRRWDDATGVSGVVRFTVDTGEDAVIPKPGRIYNLSIDGVEPE